MIVFEVKLILTFYTVGALLFVISRAVSAPPPSSSEPLLSFGSSPVPFLLLLPAHLLLPLASCSDVPALHTRGMDPGREVGEGWMEDQWEKWYDDSIF